MESNIGRYRYNARADVMQKGTTRTAFGLRASRIEFPLARVLAVEGSRAVSKANVPPPDSKMCQPQLPYRSAAETPPNRPDVDQFTTPMAVFKRMLFVRIAIDSFGQLSAPGTILLIRDKNSSRFQKTSISQLRSGIFVPPKSRYKQPRIM